MYFSVYLYHEQTRTLHMPNADPSSRGFEGVGLWPLACWYCGFESPRGNGNLSSVSVMCCQVVVSASGPSLFQRIPTNCAVAG